MYTGLAGACILVGAGLAAAERLHSRELKEEVAHFVVALGGGLIVGAVALVLVPEGVTYLSNPFFSTGLILVGGLTFMTIDVVLARHRSEAPQFVATAADFVPELLALGGMFVVGAMAQCCSRFLSVYRTFQKASMHGGNFVLGTSIRVWR